MFTGFQKTISKFLLFFVAVTFVFGSILVVQPIKRAEAVVILPAGLAAGGKAATAVSVPSVETFSWYKFAKDVFTQVMLGVAFKLASNFLTKFVSKLTEKYKIRNYLYYDQVLTNYYLTNFIRDKITDPDLRQIYILLEAGYITGQPTGLANAPNPQAALVPRLKLAINEVYKKQTGIDPVLIANPPATMSNRDYLTQAQYFYFNHPGYTETNLRNQFGAYQSASTTAAQLEILVGNSLKAGRFIGGTCSTTLPYIPAQSGLPSELGGTPNTPSGTAVDPTLSPENCAIAGGTWEKSGLDQARSFIDNPTAYVQGWMINGIQKIVDNNFNANNFWFVIGNSLGSFLWNNLFIDKAHGVLHEDPRGYTPEAYNENSTGPGEIDLDFDGVPDGYDIDNDGVVDSCVYGGTAPNCDGSTTIGGETPGGTGFVNCDTPPNATSPDPMPVMAQVLNENPNLDLLLDADRDYFTAIVAYRLWQGDPNWGRKKAGANNPISTDTLGYLRPDMGPGRFEAVDMINGSNGDLQRGCFGVVPAEQVWIQPNPAP